jgi:hypothetical protein
MFDPIRSVEENLVKIMRIKKKRSPLLMKNDRRLQKMIFRDLVKTPKSSDDSPEDARVLVNT